MDKNRFNRVTDKIENYVREDRPYYSPVHVYAAYMDRNKLILDLHTDFDHAVITLKGAAVRKAYNRDNGGWTDDRQTKDAAYTLFNDRWSWEYTDFSAVTFKVLDR